MSGQTSIREHIMSRVVIADTGCWEWQGTLSVRGYGRIKIAGASKSVHRVSYAEFVGPLVDGLTIDHLCRNRRCCNPLHLEQVTSAENTLRGMGPAALHARQTHCKRGHELTPDNIIPSSAKIGTRQCWTCLRLRNAARGSGMTADELHASGWAS
jgi:hypothetical protein